MWFVGFEFFGEIDLELEIDVGGIVWVIVGYFGVNDIMFGGYEL